MTSPIIVALDMSLKGALELVKKLDPEECKVKVGSQLFTSSGPEVIEKLNDLGFDVFLDLKFHDIPNTVRKAVEESMELGIWMLNVHSLGGKEMLRAASETVEQATVKPLLLGVTILTSLDDKALNTVGFGLPIADQVLLLAELCQREGLDGVVCSSKEVPVLRSQLNDDFIIVTPGIRSIGVDKEDQKRISSAARAIKNGANFIVIGREITLDIDPRNKIKQILETL
jgi:orotidine-5'-phosphate decarboxylase